MGAPGDEAAGGRFVREKREGAALPASARPPFLPTEPLTPPSSATRVCSALCPLPPRLGHRCPLLAVTLMGTELQTGHRATLPSAPVPASPGRVQERKPLKPKCDRATPAGSSGLMQPAESDLVLPTPLPPQGLRWRPLPAPQPPTPQGSLGTQRALPRLLHDPLHPCRPPRASPRPQPHTASVQARPLRPLPSVPCPT